MLVYKSVQGIEIHCDSPQMLLDGGVTHCGLCFSCCKQKDDADRQRRLYWLKKKRSQAHAQT